MKNSEKVSKPVTRRLKTPHKQKQIEIHYYTAHSTKKEPKPTKGGKKNRGQPTDLK